MRPKSNAFRLYRCYTTLQLSAHMNFVGPGRDPSKRCFGPPSTFCDLLRDPPKSPDRRYFVSRFFFGPGPPFLMFYNFLCVVITTSSTRVVVSISYNNIDNFSMALKLAPTPILPHFWTLKKGSKTGLKSALPKIDSKTIVSV